MDLRRPCGHCNADKGEVCGKDCSANGELVVQLDEVLRKLNIERKGLHLISSFNRP